MHMDSVCCIVVQTMELIDVEERVQHIAIDNKISLLKSREFD